MKVVYIRRRTLLGVFLLLLGVIGGGLAWNRSHITSSTGYNIREYFPSLVYLPGYQQGPKVHAAAAILIEAKSGAILYAKNEEVRRAPASTTKMMTAIVALEKAQLNQVIQISPQAAYIHGSSIPIRPGERITLKELLEGVMLESGNNGSVAVAEGVAGSVDKFVELMNLKAKEIGALKTNFRNPHGLRAPSHYTTALDLALIARYGLVDERFARIVRRRTATMEKLSGREVKISNTNRLLWSLQGADGVKTGTTNEAGHCLVASATRQGQQYIAVALNSPDRWGDCARMLDYAFNQFSIVQIADARRPLGKVAVSKGIPAEVAFFPRNNLYAVVRKGQEDLIQPVKTLNQANLQAPLSPGCIVGKLGYRFQDQTVTGVDLVIRQVVRKRGWFW